MKLRLESNDEQMHRLDAVTAVASIKAVAIPAANHAITITPRTPQGGRVELKLCRAGNENVVHVSDTGPGIPAAERDLVTRRFYRSEKSRTEPGLSLVNAIVKLHGFRFTISPGPGCVAQIAFARASSPSGSKAQLPSFQ